MAKAMTFEEKMNLVAEHITAMTVPMSDVICTYVPPLTDETLAELTDGGDAQDNNYDRLYVGNSYMKLDHVNGTTYYVNITADSPYAACEEVFGFITYHF